MNSEQVCDFVKENSWYECIEGADDNLYFCSCDESKTEQENLNEAYRMSLLFTDRQVYAFVEPSEDRFIYLVVKAENE